MTHTIEIDSARTMTTDELQDAFSASGLAGTVVDAGSRLCLEFEADVDAAQLRADVARALDAWMGERHLPLVPQHVGGGVFVLRPPAA